MILNYLQTWIDVTSSTLYNCVLIIFKMNNLTVETYAKIPKPIAICYTVKLNEYGCLLSLGRQR